MTTIRLARIHNQQERTASRGFRSTILAMGKERLAYRDEQESGAWGISPIESYLELRVDGAAPYLRV